MQGGILADWSSVVSDLVEPELVEVPRTEPVLTVEQFGAEVVLTFGRVVVSREWPNESMAEECVKWTTEELERVVATTARNIMAQFMSDALDTQEKGRRR